LLLQSDDEDDDDDDIFVSTVLPEMKAVME